MHADQRAAVGSARGGEIAHHQGEMFGAVEFAAVGDGTEVAEGGGHRRRCHLRDQRGRRTAVVHEVGDTQYRQIMVGSKGEQVVAGAHRPVFGDDLTDHPDAAETQVVDAGHGDQVDGGLGVPGAGEHAAVACP